MADLPNKRNEEGQEEEEVMHDSSMKLMQKLLNQVDPKPGSKVLDFGSYDVCGTYKPLTHAKGLEYTGLDQSAGPNVHLVENVYNLPDRLASTYDLIISGQAFEHLEHPLAAVLELQSLLKPDGTMILIAPREWGDHRCPIDCWRFLKDGMDAILMPFFETVETGVVETDCYGLATKRRNTDWSNLKRELREVTKYRVKI